MHIGVVFPQTEIGNDPVVIRDYAQTVEGLGYRHILAYDHVLSADISGRPAWTGAYSLADPFHEVFVLFGYLAAVTTQIELVTGVLILPQRQTALVAKQAAEVDLLSGGRLRLGIGAGWNEVEYDGLDKQFSNRGRRSEEQIALLRELWTHEAITFDGEWEQIDRAGITPLPVQRPIPIWIGGYADATLSRCARLADGWFPWREPNDAMKAMLEALRAYTEAAGRDFSDIGIEPRLDVGKGTPDTWASFVEAWQALGATHLCLGTMNSGFASPSDHLAALERAAKELGI